MRTGGVIGPYLKKEKLSWHFFSASPVNLDKVEQIDIFDAFLRKKL